MKILVPLDTQQEELELCRKRLVVYGLDFKISDVLGKSRERRLNGIRALIADMLKHKEYSYAHIGSLMNRDHATAMHLVSNYEHKRNGRLRNFEQIREKLRQNNTKEEILLMIDNHYKEIAKLAAMITKLEKES